MPHAINLISKDICNIPFANQILTKCNTLVTYFKKSHQAGINNLNLLLYNYKIIHRSIILNFGLN